VQWASAEAGSAPWSDDLPERSSSRHREDDRLGEGREEVFATPADAHDRDEHDADAERRDEAGVAICCAPSRIALITAFPSARCGRVLDLDRRIVDEDRRQRQATEPSSRWSVSPKSTA